MYISWAPLDTHAQHVNLLGQAEALNWSQPTEDWRSSAIYGHLSKWSDLIVMINQQLNYSELLDKGAL